MVEEAQIVVQALRRSDICLLIEGGDERGEDLLKVGVLERLYTPNCGLEFTVFLPFFLINIRDHDVIAVLLLCWTKFRCILHKRLRELLHAGKLYLKAENCLSVR